MQGFGGGMGRTTFWGKKGFSLTTSLAEHWSFFSVSSRFLLIR